MLRLSTARGLGTRFSLIGPTKIKACNLFMFTKKLSLAVNKEDMFYFAFTFVLLLYITSVIVPNLENSIDQGINKLP